VGWDFKGLYTLGTDAARARLAADELVAGDWATILRGRRADRAVA